MVPWDHAREEFTFYMPRAGVVFEGDLFASGQGNPPVTQRVTELLARTIRDRGLKAETIVASMGSPGRLRSWIRRSIAAASVRAAEGAPHEALLLQPSLCLVRRAS